MRRHVYIHDKYTTTTKAVNLNWSEEGTWEASEGEKGRGKIM